MKYIIWLSLILTSCRYGNPYDGPAEIATGQKDARDRQEGTVLFQQHCASCHNRMKEATGPPLNRALLSQRSDDWIITMITDQRHLKKDKAYRDMVKEYGGLRCPEQPISKERLAALLRYLKSPGSGCMPY